MSFTFNKLQISGVFLIKPKIFYDNRGAFLESYKISDFNKHGIPEILVQDSISISKKGVLRGLHFQDPPMEQGKLVSVLCGSIFDVMVDLRKSSQTFGKWLNVEISSTDRNILWIPKGFAHGIQVLEDNTVVSYKMTHEYSPEHERGIVWDDPQLNIPWPIANPTVSEKDSNLPKFNNIAKSDIG